MRPEIRNRVVMSRNVVVAEVEASRASRRRWLAVHPSPTGAGVTLVTFEHLATLDTDGWFAPDDVLDRTETLFDDLDALLADLADRGCDADAFEVPWDTDYPL